MDIESLYDFQGQIQQALTRAEQDIANNPDTPYIEEMRLVQSRLELALIWVEGAIKKQIEVEHPDGQAASEEPTEPQTTNQ